MGKTIGIDLGTTNSVMAVMEEGKPTVIPNAEGSTLTPSVVWFNPSGEQIVGAAAKRRAAMDPEHTVSSIKRKMGTRERVRIDGVDYSPEQISAMILKKLKHDAEAYLGEPVDKAVITIPASFNDIQRQATKDAAKIAGLEVLRIINESTAASLAYGVNIHKDESVVVFDVGGGTFNVSVLDVGDGIFEIRSIAGDLHLGGDDFDLRIVEYLADEFERNHKVDLRSDPKTFQRLRDAAERAKKDLSQVMLINVNLPFITSDYSGYMDLEIHMRRSVFEGLIGDLLERIEKAFKRALSDANLDAADIDEIVLIGGSTRIPAIQEIVKKLRCGKDANRSVNPDEAVAIGAAIQAGVLNGEIQDVVLLDVASHSLGIQLPGDVFMKFIDHNTTIPTRKSETLSTVADGQTSMEFFIYQGESEKASQNTLLGRFELLDIPQAPQGVSEIEITFAIDAHGIINVSAQDKASKKESGLTINTHGALSKSEVEHFILASERSGMSDDHQYRSNLTFLIEKKRLEKAYDVFLCHKNADKAQVKEIGRRLIKEFGILPWLDEWELRPGERWQQVLESQITSIASVAVFLGPSGLGPWQDTELAAILDEFNRNARPLIPVILAGSEHAPNVPLFLRSRMWVDFRQADPDPMSQLCFGITGQRAKARYDER
jgi:molecular chaperone DnaK